MKKFCVVIVENSGNWEETLGCYKQKGNAFRKCQAINKQKGRSGARCYVKAGGKRLPGFSKTPHARFR